MGGEGGVEGGAMRLGIGIGRRGGGGIGQRQDRYGLRWDGMGWDEG